MQRKKSIVSRLLQILF
uniref:Uncharacterized protein n=1 Tax=Arundo donax TaxID=35708 RepID=A0A0A9AC82_ARUDO